MSWRVVGIQSRAAIVFIIRNHVAPIIVRDLAAAIAIIIIFITSYIRDYDATITRHSLIH
jgi:hypothetical protein